MKKQMTKEEREMMKDVRAILSPWKLSCEEYEAVKNDPLQSGEWRANIRIHSVTHKMDEINKNLERIKHYLALLVLLACAAMIMKGLGICNKRQPEKFSAPVENAWSTKQPKQ